MSWLIVTDSAAQEAALALARGSYQRNLLLGHEAISGSTLQGKAARYSGRYRASSANLLARMRSAGIPFAEVRGARGKRVLVLGAAATTVAILGGNAEAVQTIADV